MKKDDIELIQDILSGDEAAFNELVQRHQKSVHALVWREIGDYHIAEEITQDAFLQVYNKLPTLKNPKLFSGWLYVIAKRQCIAWKRKNKHSIHSLNSMSQETLDESAYENYISQEREGKAIEYRREIVQKLLEKLPEIERTVVILHYLGEMTCDAIGMFLGVSPNTVKSRLSRARKRLREDVTIIRETLSSVPISPNLTDNIIRKINDTEPTPPSCAKPLLPLGALGSSIFLIVFLLGISNQFLTRYQLPYSLDAESETTIEIVEASIIPNIKSESDLRNRIGNDTALGINSNDGLQSGETPMENNINQDSTQWKLPQDAKARLGKGYVFDMEYSPDGTLFAAAGTIGIWIYDAHSGKEIDLLTLNTDGIAAIAFSPNNQLLASEGKDNTILLWDLKNGEQIRTFSGHQDIVKTIAFSPDGKTIASGSDDETIRIWDVSTGELRFTFAGHANEVSEVMYLKDGEMLLSYGRSEGTIHLWNANTGEYIRTFSGHTGNLTSIASSPDGKTIAGGSDVGTIHLWEPHTGELKTTIVNATGCVGVDDLVVSVVFSPDGTTLVSINADNDIIQFWNVFNGEKINTISSPPASTDNAIFSPNGNTLASTGSDGTVRFWDVASNTHIQSITGYANMFTDMEYSPDGSTLALVSSMRRLRLWDTHTRKLLKTYNPHPKRINGIAYAPDGITLACGGWDSTGNTVWLWNTKTGEHGRIFTGYKDTIDTLAFSPDGNTLACGGWDETIRLWDVNTGETIKVLTGEKDIVREIEYSPDGKMLVSSGDSGMIRFWDINTGENVRAIRGDTVALSPNWEKFVSWEYKKAEIQFWHRDSDEPIRTITSEEKTYFRTYSPDGRTIVGIDSNGRLSFCDADTGEVIQTSDRGHIQDIYFMQYSPDSRTLATSGWDSTILLWDVPQ